MAAEPILILDDEEGVRTAVADVLHSAAYSVEQASSVEAAIPMLASKSWALILSDLLMPRTNGLALLEYAQRHHHDVPVVMVTGVNDISVALEAMRMGAYDYLLKPFQREQLLAVVARAIEKRRLEMENLAYKNELESLVKARTDLLDGTMADLKRALADRERAMAELERSYDITLEALGNALDLKDAETEGHSRRVTAFTMAIAHALGLPDERRKVIAAARFCTTSERWQYRMRSCASRDDLLPKSRRSCASTACSAIRCCARFPSCMNRRRSYIPTRSISTAAAIREVCVVSKFIWEHACLR